MRSDGAAAAVSTARPQQTRCSSATPAPHPTVPIRTTDAPSSVVSHSGGGASSKSGGGSGGTSTPQHRSSHSNPTAAQRSVIRVSSASICSQLPTKSTSPSRSAVGASSESPVQKARSHAAAESRRRAATLTTPGSTPRRTSGKPKVASAVPRHGKSIPPPRVAPWHTTTLGSAALASRSCSSAKAGRPSRKALCRLEAAAGLPPKQKCSGSAPRKTGKTPSGQVGSGAPAPSRWRGTLTTCTAPRLSREGAGVAASAAGVNGRSSASGGGARVSVATDDDAPLSSDAPAAKHTAWATASASSKPESTRARLATSAWPGASCRGEEASAASLRAIASARRCVAAMPPSHTCVGSIPVWRGPKPKPSTACRVHGQRACTACHVRECARQPAERANAAHEVAVLERGGTLRHDVVTVQARRDAAADDGAVYRAHKRHGQCVQLYEAHVELSNCMHDRSVWHVALERVRVTTR
eukprot:scaffold7588_cov69-Phaeocystis_antarctica.AAC.5